MRAGLVQARGRHCLAAKKKAKNKENLRVKKLDCLCIRIVTTHVKYSALDFLNISYHHWFSSRSVKASLKNVGTKCY